MDLQKEVLDPLCPLANSADWQIKGVFLQTLSKDSRYQALIQMISLIKVALVSFHSLFQVLHFQASAEQLVLGTRTFSCFRGLVFSGIHGIVPPPDGHDIKKLKETLEALSSVVSINSQVNFSKEPPHSVSWADPL
jgi:hypothetical protein